MLSHELRTPLNPAMLSASELAKDESLPVYAREELAMIHRSIGLEARLIDDLLDLTRISKGKLQLHLQPVDAHQLLAESRRILRKDAELKHLSVDMDLGAVVHHVNGDSARLQQVFWNLLKNAIKFTNEGGSITIRSFNEQRGRLVVQMKDTGIGISRDALSKIFSAFEQGGTHITRQFGGLGLGLTISKGLVMMQGGELTAASEGLGKGTTMTVILPVTSETAATESINETSTCVANASILVVDDDVPTAQTLARLLKRRGYQVQTANALAEAREVLRGNRFDILISDLSLPDGSGLDLIREVPALQLRAIALSGLGMDSDIHASLAAGFAKHLVKPIDFDELLTAIRET